MEVYSSLRGIEVAPDSSSDTVHREKSNTAHKAPDTTDIRIRDSAIENSTEKKNPFFRPGDL